MPAATRVGASAVVSSGLAARAVVVAQVLADAGDAAAGNTEEAAPAGNWSAGSAPKEKSTWLQARTATRPTGWVVPRMPVGAVNVRSAPKLTDFTRLGFSQADAMAKLTEAMMEFQQKNFVKNIINVGTQVHARHSNARGNKRPIFCACEGRHARKKKDAC